MKVEYTLRELRISKGITQNAVAKMLNVSQAMYSAIESGQRKPTVDTLFAMARLYGTSMDFIYHAFYRQRIEFDFPDGELRYGMRTAKEQDIKYLRERFKAPEKEPGLSRTLEAMLNDSRED